jgi:hypothetical protein
MLRESEQVDQAERRFLTLEELLACVLLEESFMCNWAGKVIDHQFKYWLNSLFSVASIVCQSWVLLSISYFLKLKG